ncbi:MAG: hypothetical protein K6T59_12715 [Bryobacteraceae bacterium]|nr:hypothetical protein [Bryobacteraceae bacterium]
MTMTASYRIRAVGALLPLLLLGMPQPGAGFRDGETAANPKQLEPEPREIIVTTLLDTADDPPIRGSLRWAMAQAEGPARIVFAIGGNIDLETKLTIAVPFVTIDGGTAPREGITLRRCQVEVVNTHDVVLRNLRLRAGDGFANDDERRKVHGNYDGKGTGPDSGGWRSLLIIATPGQLTHDILVENCSIQNITDDNGSVSGPCRRIIFRRCLFSGGYAPFTKGLLTGDDPDQPPPDFPDYLAIDQCLFAFLNGRAPDLNGGVVQMINNVVCGTVQGGLVTHARINLLNNYFLTLENHPWGKAADRLLTADANCSAGAYYLSGNMLDGRLEKNRLLGIRNKAQTDLPRKAFRHKPWPGAPNTLLKADDAIRRVLGEAGCVRPMRDQQDEEIVDKVRQRAALLKK